jgi:hypothetical protein
MELARRFVVGIASSVALLCLPATGFAAPILLSTVASFGVLGASAVTNTGPTTVGGNLGVSNNSSPTGITGFYGTLADDGPGTFGGTVHQGDAFAMLGDSQLVTAMGTLSGMGPVNTLLLADLAGLTLNPGVYQVPVGGASNLTGVLTLDGLGNADALWVFLFSETLITSTGSVVQVVNVGSASGTGLFWNVGSSATLEVGTTFLGNILASTSITINDSVTLNCGRALAHTGAVTLSNDTISTGCAGTGFEASGGFNAGLGETAVPVPEPATLTLLVSGILAAATRRRARV